MIHFSRYMRNRNFFIVGKNRLKFNPLIGGEPVQRIFLNGLFLNRSIGAAFQHLLELLKFLVDLRLGLSVNKLLFSLHGDLSEALAVLALLGRGTLAVIPAGFGFIGYRHKSTPFA